MTTEATTTPRGSYTWPLIIIGLLVAHATILFTMVSFAVSDPNFRIVRDTPATPPADAAPAPADTLPAERPRP